MTSHQIKAFNIQKNYSIIRRTGRVDNPHDGKRRIMNMGIGRIRIAVSWFDRLSQLQSAPFGHHGSNYTFVESVFRAVLLETATLREMEFLLRINVQYQI